jgi:hypothetical protein
MAIEKYTAALELSPSDYLLLSNRAQTYLKLDEYDTEKRKLIERIQQY